MAKTMACRRCRSFAVEVALVVLLAAPSGAQSLFDRAEGSEPWKESKILHLFSPFMQAMRESSPHYAKKPETTLWLRRSRTELAAVVVISHYTSAPMAPVRLALDLGDGPRVIECEAGRESSNALASAGEWLCPLEPDFLDELSGLKKMDVQVEAAGFLLPKEPRTFNKSDLKKLTKFR